MEPPTDEMPTSLIKDWVLGVQWWSWGGITYLKWETDAGRTMAMAGVGRPIEGGKTYNRLTDVTPTKK